MKNSQNSLTETTFLILLSFVNPKHGYAVIKEVEEWTEGRVVLAAGTLYSSLETLKKKGYIEEVYSEDPRRKMFTLTETGYKIIADDFNRMEKDVELYKKIIERKAGVENVQIQGLDGI